MFTRDHVTGPVAQGSYGRRAAVTLPPGHGDVGQVDMGRLCLQEQDILVVCNAKLDSARRERPRVRLWE